MRNRLTLLLVATTALSGCSFAPPHTRPDAPVAPAYPDTDGVSGRRATEIGWDAFFTDPALKARIAAALDNNRDLRIATARIEEARGQYRIQASEQLPQLGLSGSATRTRVGAGGLGVGGGSGVPVTGGDSVTVNRWQVGVGVTSFEVDLWGRVRNLSEAARSQYLATVAAQRAFRLSLIRDVAAAYLAERSIAERIALAERTLASRGEGLRIAKLRLDAGVTSALDYRQAETLLTQAETELAALRRSLAEARNLSAVLIGGPLPVEAEALPLANQGIVRDIAPGLPSELLNDRPDIIAAEEQLRAARANIGAARAAFFPAISLTGSAGFASTALGDLFGSDGFTWSFGPSINLPIFDWGARKGNLSVAEARADIAVATYERTVQTAFREVADALAGRRWLAEQIAAQERAVAAQRSLAGLAHARYDNGIAQYIEVLDAERNLFAAEQALLALRQQQLANQVTLYVALGGGLGGQ